MQYRKVLYANYHTTQSGRASGTDALSLFQREKEQFRREILPHISELPKAARIFDMGCGSGSMLKALQEAGYTNARGMDISDEQVQLAQRLGVSNVEAGDALKHLASGSAQYDLVLGMDIIEHFTKDELVELLQSVLKGLSAKGKAVFRTPNLDAPMATVFANGDFTHENYMNASSAQQVCRACGFTKVDVRPSLMRVGNPAKELLRRFFFAVWQLRLKVLLFATARSSRDVLFTPNMIILASK